MSIEHGFVWMKIIPAAVSKAADLSTAGYGGVSTESADRPPKHASTESADRPPTGASNKSSDRPPKLTIVEETTVAAAGQHTAKFTRAFKDHGAAKTWLQGNEGQHWKTGALRCCLVEVSESTESFS
ncbi:hypothetical protein J2X16_002079 [Pelomonas aquatica]|uniref:Uncharacterized protein n=1 Tax=Pelomonas aquatica TaxID=431058 RepID=A0ABU1Z7Y7_9BURK|nr:hypothetical protein [Pelomonas aquatica]MDR7296732.1 hypothetical protein [Pelomonas aquatica]